MPLPLMRKRFAFNILRFNFSVGLYSKPIFKSDASICKIYRLLEILLHGSLQK